MPDLTRQTVRDTYRYLLQLPGDTAGGRVPAQTGDGDSLPLEISDTEVAFTDTVDFSGATVVGLPGVAEPVVDEAPAGAINGSNATYTTAFPFIPLSVEVFVNGVRQRRVTDFNTTGTTTILLSESPTPGETLRVNYLKG